MRRFLLASFFVLLFVPAALAALTFPALTGRVVDEAGILSQETQSNLVRKLANYEQQSGNQIVVVTLKSLQGSSIEDYGYQLGRTWGVGQKGQDNGVLVILAPQEHKVRLEVGYGLEGVLTDAQSSIIIQNEILPEFRLGNMDKGVIQGTEAIIQALNMGLSTEKHPTTVLIGIPKLSTDQKAECVGIFLFFVVISLLAYWMTVTEYNNDSQRKKISRSFFSDFLGNFFNILFLILRILSILGSRSNSSSDSFSGGGGSFGGGGASGSW